MGFTLVKEVRGSSSRVQGSHQSPHSIIPCSWHALSYSAFNVFCFWPPFCCQDKIKSLVIKKYTLAKKWDIKETNLLY